jgi:hypothetical protein
VSAPDGLIERRVLLEVEPGSGALAPKRFSATLTDTVGEAAAPTCELLLRGGTDEAGDLIDLELEGASTPLLDELVGQSSMRGLRRRLDPLRAGSPELVALRRLLWDLPIALMISSQALMVDHPAIPAPMPMLGGMPGVDQCSGWRRGGQMLTLIEESGGVLRTELSDETVTDDHLGDPAPLPLAPMATRRRRRIRVERDADRIELLDHQRDSYADPDGIERALHHWIVRGEAAGLPPAVESISVEARALPWLECPAAAGSAQRLVGRPLAEIEGLVRAEFGGITTCTHLNDTLLALSSVPELLAALERSS